MSTENTRYLRRRRKRKQKIRKLLGKYEKADARDKAKIVEKLWKINPAVIPQEAIR